MRILDMYYILDDNGNPVAEPDIVKWAHWYEKAERHVGNTYFGDIHVSTVFLAIPHVNKQTGDMDMLFETMVFADEATLQRISELAETDDRSVVMYFLSTLGGKERWDIQKRYATREEAVKGHESMCSFISTCIAEGLIEVKNEAVKE